MSAPDLGALAEQVVPSDGELGGGGSGSGGSGSGGSGSGGSGSGGSGSGGSGLGGGAPAAAAEPPALPRRSAVPDPSGVLARWRAGRLDPGRRGVAALALVAVLAAVVAGVVVLRARPHAVLALAPAVVAPGVPVPGGRQAAPSLPAAGSTARSSRTSAAPSSTSEVVVAVGGRVVRPGLVRLPPGSRVDDALRAAGGPLPAADLGTLNLARLLTDGEQVLVGVPAVEAPVSATTSAPPAAAGGAPAAGPVDLNAATPAQLDALPGIGPVLAQKIVDWRAEHGRFDSVEQLRDVSGIGESKYGELVARVRV